MDPVTYYEFELNQIQHQSIRDLVIRIMKEKLPAYFMTVEASSSGFYHQIEKGVPIKLCEHVKAAARFFLILKTNPLFTRQFTSMQLDYMLSAILLHDGTKRGLNATPSPSAYFEHPITSVYLAPDNMNQIEYAHFTEIIRLITTHHGPWRISSYSSIELPEVSDNMQYYVHLCDFLASRSVIWTDISDEEAMRRRYV